MSVQLVMRLHLSVCTFQVPIGRYFGGYHGKFVLLERIVWYVLAMTKYRWKVFVWRGNRARKLSLLALIVQRIYSCNLG